jgi:glycosyltransferase involved in cell wall biosynthesis
MKVAFFTYPAAFQNIGGGEVQLLKTKEYLEREGVRVDFFDIWRGRIENYDLLHVFGSVKDCLGLVEVAKSRGVKVALSPVLWSDMRRALFTDGSIKTKVDFTLRHVTKVLLPAFPSERRKLLLLSDIIFPNSEMEKKQIARLFAIPSEKIKVVHNGVSPDFSDSDPGVFQARHGKTPFILSVGRIEPRKNQLNLIRAVRGIPGARLVLIGNPVSGYETYAEKCRKEGGTFTEFLPTLSHEDTVLKSAYAACSVFVLPGWFETPGLVALEAALAGAVVVATKGGSTREYFEDSVDYLDPSSPEDIRQKIVRNLERPKRSGLKERVLAHFTWDKVARQTLSYYDKIRPGQRHHA